MLDFSHVPKNLRKILKAIYIKVDEENLTSEFDLAMFNFGFFEMSSGNNNGRRVTEVANNLGYYGVIKILTGLNKLEVKSLKRECKQYKHVAKMFKYAKKYGYTILDNDDE